MPEGVFQVLIVIGLFALVVVLAVVAVGSARRARARIDAVTPALTTSLPATKTESDPAASSRGATQSLSSAIPPGGADSAARVTDPTGSGNTDAAASDQLVGGGSPSRPTPVAAGPGYAEAQALHAKAEALLASAQTVRAESDEAAASRRVELREQRADLERREGRLSDREERLDAEARTLDEKVRALDQAKSDLKAQRKALADLESQHRATLEQIAGLTAEQAKQELVAAVEHDAKRHAVIVARDIERQAVRDADARAKTIIVGAIQRLASEQTSESVVTAVHLPGDDMKGRIIGREGRNIRAFEQVTGVNVMIDDTPESVLLSCFDPVRRETARITLVELVKDGRIHPARIEEVHARSKSQIEEQCLRAAEDAMAEVGISDLHPALVPVLGTLRYRTSYGQNVLKHLVESGHIAGLMAAELGLDADRCRRAAFLHDIGKALTHEVEGSHAIIGADLARKYGEDADIVHAIEAHHNEVEVKTVEAVLVQAADAISGSRPGARRESIEAYVQRLEKLEEIAGAREGVDKVFAMQAGREVRVMVVPEVVDDIEAQVLARDIVKQIEEELTYPGQIKVTVVRESRATETAR